MKTATLNDVIKVVEQLSDSDQLTLLATLQERFAIDDEWALEGDQLAFMLQHHDQIEAAYASDDMSVLDELEASPEYRALFGDMPWDEAYDRYEETWWHNGVEQDT